MSKLIKKYLSGLVIYNSPRDVELHLEKDLPTTPEMLRNYERSLERLKHLNSPEEPMDATIRLLSNGTSTYRPTAQLMLRDMHGTKELSFSDYLGLIPIALPTVVAAGAIIPEAAAAASNLGFWGELLKDLGTYYVGDKVSEKLTGKGIGPHINDAFGLEDEHPVGELIGFSAASPIRKVATKAAESAAKLMSPKYALSKAIDEAPLNQEMLASYYESLPELQYYYSDFINHEGAFPFLYQSGHLHGVDPADVGIMLSRNGLFDKNVKPGPFKFKTTLPSGRYINNERVPVLPSNYPILVAVNPELPTASWGYRGTRNNADRIVKVEDVSNIPKTNRVQVAGEVSNGKVTVKTVFGLTSKSPRTFGPIYADLIGDRPPENIVLELNQSRAFYDQYGIIDSEAIPARNPYNKGSRYSFIPYKSLRLNYPPSSLTAEGLWASGKQEAINYLTSDVYKDRLMTNLGFTEQEADLYILLQLKNLDNVELINLGLYKIGRPFGHTIGYTVGEQSGPYTFERILKTSDWLPTGWNEDKYLEFIKPYEQHFSTYNKAKLGITQVGLSEGPAVKFAKTPFEEATHAASRGGMDPALDVIFDRNTKLVNNLRGTSPRMLNPVEARTAGMELDRAWEAAQPYINEFYKGMPEHIQKERFFYDYLKASDDAGQAFYQFMLKNAPNWVNKYGVEHDLPINNFVNGIDPDEAAFEFWRDFVLNNVKPQDISNNEFNIT